MTSVQGRGLSSNQIKLLAILTMTLDQLVWLFFPGCRHEWWTWKEMKRLLYVYYPAQLFVIGLLRLAMGTESIFP